MGGVQCGPAVNCLLLCWRLCQASSIRDAASGQMPGLLLSGRDAQARPFSVLALSYSCTPRLTVTARQQCKI